MFYCYVLLLIKLLFHVILVRIDYSAGGYSCNSLQHFGIKLDIICFGVLCNLFPSLLLFIIISFESL